MTHPPTLLGGTPFSPNTAQLFYAATDFPEPAAKRLRDLLSPDERARAARLRIPAKRDEFERARGLLRLLLSHFLMRPPMEVEFASGPHGKPHIAGTPLHFNVSHTAGTLLIAITKTHPVGVDIEQINPALSFLPLAKTYFTPPEYAELLAAPESGRLLAFYRGWTRKEALLKATGEGIAIGIATAQVPLHETNTPLTITPWILHDLPVPTTHAACLALPHSPTATFKLQQIQASHDGLTLSLSQYP